VHHLTLRPEHLTAISGIPVTTLARTTADLMRRLDRAHAVAVADSALRRDAAVAEDVGELLRRGAGSARARRWLALADGRAESPLETRVRLDCLDGGVLPDELQHRVCDGRGQLLGIADMAWLSARVIAEADGVDVHSATEALFRDRRRQNDLANEGWTVLRFTWADTLRSGYVAGTVRQALNVRGRAC
jgi:very-short-patch-repair endonuclease